MDTSLLYMQAMADLPGLLQDEVGWKDLLVTYEEPMVERLYRPYRDGRIMLHRIYPCKLKKALFHPHPWPSTTGLLQGSYMMEIGTSPIPSMRVLMQPGSIYTMDRQEAWHSVSPMGEWTLSVMVLGPKWATSVYDDAIAGGFVTAPPREGQPPLPLAARRALFDDFRRHIPY